MPRTPRKLDYETIKKLASIGCTDREIAAVVGFTAVWLSKRKKHDEKLEDAIEKGREQGKASLRRVQWQKAMEGNTTMMIWLGKQILGQRDRVEHAEVTERPDVKADDLTDDQLAAIIAANKQSNDATKGTKA